MNRYEYIEKADASNQLGVDKVWEWAWVGQKSIAVVEIYRKAGDCRIGLVISDTSVSAILLLQSCKKQMKEVLLPRKTCCELSPYW
jgi:hypothetical protein